jgi:YidC/Oxa1 family membrane protein insertase
MGPEKRVVFASALSVAAMLAYVSISAKLSGARRDAAPTTQSDALRQNASPPLLAAAADQSGQSEIVEEAITLESPQLRLYVGSKSARIKHAALKAFENLQNGGPLQFGSKYDLVTVTFPSKEVHWELRESTDQSATWVEQGNESTRLVLQLDRENPVFRYTLEMVPLEGGTPVQVTTAWGPAEGSISKNRVEAFLKTSRKHLHYNQGSTKHVPRGTLMVTLTEQFFCQSMKLGEGQSTASVRLGKLTHAMTATTDLLIQQPSHTFEGYVGPRDYFWMERAKFAEALPVGILGTIGLYLMLILKWMAAVTRSYGLAVIGLSILVTTALSPFSLISFRSMKKMQELQPKLDQIRKKHESAPKRVNQEIFALFKEHRVSPLSGCLPMLLQMPIFFALWSAIGHVVELRGESFLWIQDLSMPDRLAALPFGLDFNLLPILMAGAMYLQTKLTSANRQVGAEQNPMTGPLMPALFGLMFYNVQACLVLYWLSNSLASIAIYRASRL